MPTIGVDFKYKTLEVDGKTIKLEIWDCGGQNRFREANERYFKRAQGIIMTYDITDKKTFDKIEKWKKDIEDNVDENVAKIICGSKCDQIS